MNARVLRNIFALFSLHGGTYLLPLITLPYLVRTLGVGSYGQLGFSLAFIQYFILLVDYGFNLSATRAIARHQEDRLHVSHLFWNIIACKVLLAVIGMFLLFALVELVPTLKILREILFVSYLLVLGNVLLPIWLFQGLETMGLVALCTFAAKALAVPATFWLVDGPDDTWLAATIQGGASVLGGVAAMALIYQKGWIAWVRPTFMGIKNVVADGWHVFLSTASISLYTSTNVVLLGFLVGDVAVGHYVAADKIRAAVQGVATPISQAIYPRVNALMMRDESAAFRLISRLLLGQGGLMLILSIGLAVLAPWIVELAYGRGHQETIAVLRWLAPIPFFVALSNVLGVHTMLTIGMNRIFSRILLMAGLVNVTLVVPLSIHRGAEGTAAAALLTEALVAFVMIGVLYMRQTPLFRKQASDAV